MDISDIILIISAITVSIVSLIFSIYFSKKQIEHNENSVRPLCRIHQTYYIDLISVILQNGGTGPLIITKFICKDKSNNSYNSLFDILKGKIKQKKYLIVCLVKDRIIPAGDFLWLFKINPQNDDTWNNIMDILKDMTYYIEYKDIYNNTFKERRSFKGFTIGDNKISCKELPNFIKK